MKAESRWKWSGKWLEMLQPARGGISHLKKNGPDSVDEMRLRVYSREWVHDAHRKEQFVILTEDDADG